MSDGAEQSEIEALRERVTELEDSRHDDALEIRDSVQTDIERYREDVVKPRFDELEAEIESLRSELKDQRETLDSITGPGDGEPTKHEHRVRAVRKMMKNQAEAREHGTLGWSYNDVIGNLEANGHGKVYPQQAYRVMEDAAEADGYGYTKNDGGEKRLRVSLSALPSHGGVNDVNNGEEVAEGSNGHSNAAAASND